MADNIFTGFFNPGRPMRDERFNHRLFLLHAGDSNLKPG